MRRKRGSFIDSYNSFSKVEKDYLRRKLSNTKKINDIIKALYDREFLVNHPMSFKEIGDNLRISEIEAKIIFNNALIKLRKSEQAKKLKEYLENY
ncbi:hypothetical protein CQA66_08250 [Helicobacter aurati]|uniref:Uncharacterized protein n=1 Tax=Helicobacter aurati TaxID=137778 RepID=A0A3D8IYN9_9HELI|nr:hypothetical protein [Helicobacter aurati]RDU70389.1 hypothetical protein CQA66_08250 [Helicobacter aurati]